MNPSNKLAFEVLLAFLISFVTAFLGCQSDVPNSPSNEIKIKRLASQLQFLKPKETRFKKTFMNKEYIVAFQGGTILVGDETSGYSSINFMPGDLRYDTLVTFRWDSQNFIADLSPHAIDFNNPIHLSLSYRDAELIDVNEKKIQIWYFNETENIWELMGGEVNTVEKQVDGFINHFSRYALAEED